MHPNRTDRFIRRLVIFTLLVAAVAIGTLSSGPADAATRTTERAAGQADGSAEILDTGDGGGAALAAVAPASPVLVDFTPEPADGTDGAVPFQAPTVDGLTVGHAEGPGTAESPGSYMAGEGCSIQCITSGVAYARGVGALLRVTTFTEATITLFVEGPGGPFVVQSGPGQVGFEHHFDQLQPGQTYHATAVAMDASGQVSVAEGDFVTLERHVTISMSHALVVEHDFPSSVFMKRQWVDGQWLEDHAYGGMALQNGPLGPAVVWMPEEIELTSVGRHLDLAVQLFERGEPYTCEEAFGIDAQLVDGPATGEAPCYEWAYAELPVGFDDLDARPADATSWVEHTLVRTLDQSTPDGALPKGYESELQFTVPVTLHVTYS